MSTKTKKKSTVEKVEKEVRTLPEMDAKEAEEFRKKVADESVGKYVVATVSKNNSTSFKLVDLNSESDEPMLRLFAVTWDDPQDKGAYICQIEGVRLDKKNHPYLVIKPVHNLGEIHYKSLVWDFFLPCGVLWDYYGTERPDNKDKKMNVMKAYSLFCPSDESDDTSLRQKIFMGVLNGDVRMAALNNALNRRDSYENAAMYTRKRFERDQSLPPFLTKRMKRENMNFHKLVEFFEREHESYVKLGLTGAKSLIDEAEAVMSYYNDKKKEA